MLANSLIKQVEKDYLTALTDLMKKKKYNVQMARDITQRFLALLPFESHDDMSEKIKKFTNTYSEFSNIFIQYLNLEEKYKTGDLLQKINILMQGDKLQALATISAKL